MTQLDKQLDKQYEIFISQRKFLTEGGEPIIDSLGDEMIERKVQNDYAIEYLIHGIKFLAYE